MLVKLDILIDRLQPFFTGLGEPVILKSINSVARKFCQKSSVWRDYSDAIQQLSGDKFVDVSFGKGVDVFRIANISVGNKRLAHYTDDEAMNYDLNFHNKDSKVGNTFAYTTIAADKPVLIPSPDENMELYIYAYLRPSRKDGLIPEEILDEHEDTIVYGVMAELLRIQAEPGADIETSTKYYARKFISGVQKASGAIRASNSNRLSSVDLSNCGY